jgi:hypothetical protein
MEPKKTRAALWIAAVIAVLFIMPWTRNVLLVQLGLGLIPTYSNRMLEPPHVAPKVPGNLAQALAIGRRDVMESKSILVYRKLIEKYPNEPALYANLLRYASLCGPFTGPGRPEIDKPGDQPSAQWKPYADSPELRMVEDAIEKGKTLDPDNAYFDFFEAVLRFGQKRDSDALAAIHRAAGKRKFDAYLRE